MDFFQTLGLKFKRIFVKKKDRSQCQHMLSAGPDTNIQCVCSLQFTRLEKVALHSHRGKARVLGCGGWWRNDHDVLERTRIFVALD